MPRKKASPWGLRVNIERGEYQQHDLVRAKRLRDEDVERLALYWTQGRSAVWIGRALRSVLGRPLHHLLVYSHARRLEDQGILPPGAGAEPCRYWRGEPLQPTIVLDASGRTRVIWPYRGDPAYRGKGGRPPGPSQARLESERAAVLARYPDAPPGSYVDAQGVLQRPGMTWRQIKAEREAAEAREREAVRQSMDVRPSKYAPPDGAGVLGNGLAVPIAGDVEQRRSRRARNAKSDQDRPASAPGDGNGHPEQAPAGGSPGRHDQPGKPQRARRRRRGAAAQEQDSGA